MCREFLTLVAKSTYLTSRVQCLYILLSVELSGIGPHGLHSSMARALSISPSLHRLLLTGASHVRRQAALTK
jgi:hypothetical protein